MVAKASTAREILHPTAIDDDDLFVVGTWSYVNLLIRETPDAITKMYVHKSTSKSIPVLNSPLMWLASLAPP